MDFSKYKPKVEKVDCPAWGDNIFVKKITVGVLSDYMDFAERNEKENGIRVLVKLVSQTMCDKGGKLIATEQQLLELDSDEVENMKAVFEMACKINGIEAEEKEAEEVPGKELSASPSN